MPLLKGCSRDDLQANVKMLIEEGRDEAQAYAIAYSFQRKHCTNWLFVYGWASLEQVLRFLSMPDIRVAKAALAPNYKLGSFGGQPGPVRSNGSELYGFVVSSLPEDMEMLQRRIRGSWKIKTISVRTGREATYLAQTLVPEETEHEEVSSRLASKVDRNIADFWE